MSHHDHELLRWLEAAGTMDRPRLARSVEGLPDPVVRSLDEMWIAHAGQGEPDGDWRVWLLMAGRGFGKTRAGAEWVSARARADGGARIALVGASLDEVAAVMVHGESGLLAVQHTGEPARWDAGRRVVRFASGAEAQAFSGASPEKLRGPQHDFAWCDELAKWRHPEAAWDNLQLGLRLGTRPRTVVTTTPKPLAMLTRLVGGDRVVATGGPTRANPHLPAAFLEAVTKAYGGTRLGRQELGGELIADVEGSLWPRALIEGCRVEAVGSNDLAADLPSPRSPAGESPSPACGRGFRRVVVGVDPPASAEGDACGIVVAGLGRDGVAYVLADASVAGLSPDGWARAVARAAEAWGADRVVAEKNNGGDMVEAVLRGAGRALPLRLVHAAEAKGRRAEPVAALFERGEARFAGCFPALEDELAGMTAGGGYRGPGRSPDRADACVHALAELMLGRAAAEPRIERL